MASAEAVLAVVGEDLGVEMALDPTAVSGARGYPAFYEVQVSNVGGVEDTYTLTVEVPSGWTYELSSGGEAVSEVTLPPDVLNTVSLQLEVVPAADASPDDYPIIVTATSQTDAGTQDTAAGTLTVLPYGVDVEVAPESTTMDPLGTHTWNVTVTNTGTQTDTFDLTAEGAISTEEGATFNPSAVTLEAGESTVVLLTAGPQPTTLPGTDSFLVAARSQGEPQVVDFDTAEVTFESVEGAGMELLPPAQTVIDILEATFVVVISNTGTVDDVYVVNADATPALALELETVSVYVPHHTTANVVLTATAPTDGDYTITAWATSASSAAVYSDTALLTVVITNKPPVAVDDDVTTDEDVSTVIDVLANDTDVDGDLLAVDSVTPPAHGSAMINGVAPLMDVTYTPAADYCGSDSFTYVVSDSVLTDTATVDVTVTCVNDAPVAVDDSATTEEDTATAIDVLANDTDVDGDSLSIESATTPSHGSVLVTFEDTLLYTPDPDYNGADSFTYVVTDGVLTDTAAVTVTVTPLPDAPVAVDDSATTDQDTAVTIDVLANDVDADGDSLSVASVTQGFHGTVTNNGVDVTYTPDSGYSGTDSFTYVATDGVLTGTATVAVTVDAAVSECDLYPIALHADTLGGVEIGQEIEDIYNGAGHGNFGWLTWTGDPSVPVLVQSLTPPGDSYTYVNPHDPDDHVLTVGDWVYGKPGVSNSQAVRDALDGLLNRTIIVPIWDEASGSGSNLAYRVVGFARVRITDYRLPGSDRISVVFQGYAICDASCDDAVPVDLVYVLDVSGSMGQAYHGRNTKLEAAKQAILTTNEWVARQNNGSRVALVTFHGGYSHGKPPIYPADIQLVSGFTEDVEAFNAMVLELDASGSTPTAAALEEITDWLPGATDPDHQVVVIVISDGVPTVDLEGHGFADQYVQQVSLYDRNGEFLTPDEVRQRGKYYSVYRERAGEPLADTMVAIQHLKAEMPEVTVHAVAVQTSRKGIFSADVLEYVAVLGEGEFFTARDVLGLTDALQRAYVGGACGGIPPNAEPLVDVGPDQVVNVGDTVAFVGTFTDPDPLDTHTVVWDFGDGDTADSTLTPNHVYAAAGVYTVTLTATDSRGGVGSDTLVVTVEMPPFVPSCLHASQSVKIRDRATVEGSVSSGGYVEIGAKARVEGNVVAEGDAFLRWRARVEGDVTLGGRLRRQPDVVITGELNEGASVTVPDIPEQEVVYGTHNVTVKNGESETWAPGDYKDGTVRIRGKAVLTAGTYNFRDLRIEPKATLVLDTSGGEIVVNVDRQLELEDRSQIRMEGDNMVTFYTNDEGTLKIGADVTFRGAIIAPHAEVHVFSRTVFEGHIAAKRIVLEPEVTLHCSQ